jgi:hypothetical protein
MKSRRLWISDTLYYYSIRHYVLLLNLQFCAANGDKPTVIREEKFSSLRFFVYIWMWFIAIMPLEMTYASSSAFIFENSSLVIVPSPVHKKEQNSD